MSTVMSPPLLLIFKIPFQMSIARPSQVHVAVFFYNINNVNEYWQSFMLPSRPGAVYINYSQHQQKGWEKNRIVCTATRIETFESCLTQIHFYNLINTEFWAFQRQKNLHSISCNFNLCSDRGMISDNKRVPIILDIIFFKWKLNLSFPMILWSISDKWKSCFISI